MEEIDSLRLHQNAKLVLKENFSGNLGWTYLNHNTQIRFDPEDPNFPIKEIEFKCDIKEYPSKSKLLGFGCMDNFDNLKNKTSLNAKIYCDPPFNGKQNLKLVYMEDSHAFWEFDSTNIVYKFGYLERVDKRWMQCLDSKQLTDLQLINEKKNINPEESWTKIFDSESLTIYLDTKNIVQIGNENRFWTFYSYKKRRCMAYCDATMHGPEYVDSGKFYIGMNCSELLYRSMSYRYFYIEDGIRRTYDSGNGVGDWRSIIDDDDLLLKDKICHQ